VLLKAAFDKAALTKDEDPEGYRKARIAYFTLLNGQGWLQGEKQRIAEKDVAPVLKEYTATYNSLKGEQQSQSMFAKLANMFTSQPNDNMYADKLKTKADVLNRMNELNAGTPVTQPTPSSGYLGIIIDGIIALLLVIVLYLAYKRFGSSGSTSSPAVADIVT
jgi:tetrahydromethanopterin S-methyltransferase subunit F